MLQEGEKGKCYTGRVWRGDDQWSFQEEGMGIAVTVAADPDLSARQTYQQRDAKLYRAMRAEYVKLKKAAARAAARDAAKADVPKTASDMAVKCKSPEGKLLYVWGDSNRGHIEVPVTPRALRAPEPDDASAYRRAAARESTPERALRKMTAKVRKLHAKAARGEQERIVAKAPLEGVSLPQCSEQTDTCRKSLMRQLCAS